MIWVEKLGKVQSPGTFGIKFELYNNMTEHLQIPQLEGEQWIQFYELYYISNYGRIYSYKSKFKYSKQPGKLLKTYVDNVGYCNQCLNYRRYKLHRLVAELFIPNPNNLPEVHHIDHNPLNNHVNNLMWVTHKDNIRYSFASGLRKPVPRGKDNWNYGRITTEQSRKLMGIAKLGKNHPKFKGYYVIDGKIYESANQAGKALGLPAITITRRTKSGKFPGYEFVPKKAGRT